LTLRFLLDHEPEARRGARWLGVAEWVAHQLGASQAADLSLASRSGFLDLAARAWWDGALRFAGAPDGLLPELAMPGTALGRVPDDHPLAAMRGAAICTAGLDHSAGAAGAGALADGLVFDSCGTAPGPVPAAAPWSPERVGEAVALGLEVNWHVVPGRQAVLGAQLLGLELQRAAETLGSPRHALERDDHPRTGDWRAAIARAADGSAA